jgi:hypothetical protein
LDDIVISPNRQGDFCAVNVSIKDVLG